MAELTLTCPKCRQSSNVAVEADVDEFTCQHCGAKSPVIGDYETLGRVAKDPLIGQSIADWEIVQKVGEGGFGAVYKAIDKNLQRPVAIKVMLQSLSSNLEFVQKFYREAITAAALNHPNIVGIHRVGRDEQRNLNFLVMEFLEGKTLADILEERGAFTVDDVVSVILQCADALAAAHDKNIVHRDIKPENIMMDSRGVVKITDFGLAKTLSSDQKSTKVMGTPHFMSPEQFEGKAVDGRTDIYSLGVTFYFLLTRAKPYKGENTVQIIYSILTQEPQPVTELAPDVPEEIWRIIRKMIAKDANERYATFRDLRRDLLAFQQGVETKKMPCPACRAVNLRGRRFCMKCGASLIVRCPHCGREEPAGTQHCSGCGSNIESLVKVRENLDRGEKLRGFGDLKKALNCYKEVLKIDPAHQAAASATRSIEESLQRLARRRSEVDALVEKGHPDEALSALQEFVREFKDSEEVQNYGKTVRRTIVHRAVDMCVQDAEKARAEGRFEDAIAAYRRALETDPERTDISERLNELKSRLDAVEETIAAAEKALAGGRPGEALRLARDVLAFKPDHARATQIAEESRRGVESVESFVVEARELLGRNRFEDAIDRLRMAQEISPTDEKVRALLAQSEAAKKAFEKRIDGLRESVAAGRLDAALAESEALLAMRSDLPAVVSLRKEAERLKSELEYAEETRKLLAVARKAEEEGDLERGLAAAAEVLGREEANESAQELKTRLEQKISDVASFREAADKHLGADELQKAMDALRQIQRLRARDAGVAAELRATAAKQELVDRALGAARELAQRGRFEQALVEVEKALAAAPKHGEAGRLKRDATKSMNAIRKHLGDARKRIESELFEEAIRELSKASEAGAPEEDLAELRAAAEEGHKVLRKAEASHAFTLGEYEDAERILTELLQVYPDDRDAKKGIRNARKAIVRSEREGVFGKVLVSAALLIGLAFVQYRAVQGGSGILPNLAEQQVAALKEQENVGGTDTKDADAWRKTSEEYQKQLDEERRKAEEAKAAADEAKRKADEDARKAADEQARKEAEAAQRAAEQRQREAEEAERRRQQMEDGQKFTDAIASALSRGGEDGLGGLAALKPAEDLVGADANRAKTVAELKTKLSEKAFASAAAMLVTDEAPAGLGKLKALDALVSRDLAEQIGLPGTLKFAETLVAALETKDPESRIAALRGARAIAGGTPEVRMAREGRVDGLISEAVQEWVRVTGEATGGTNWQQRAEAYARILEDETVQATVLPDGTPLVTKVGAYHEFAQAMGQAEAKLARQSYADALEAYDFAGSQAREETDRRAAADGRERVRNEWIESFRRKISDARVYDSEEFYEQVIRPLSEMARVLGLSAEEAFRMVTGR